MDTFLGTLIFLLPGLMLYFWLQSFGINPVVKHNPTEFTAVTILLWFPVSLTSLLIFNVLLKHQIIPQTLKQIWTITQFKSESDNLLFLILFLGISLLVSIIYGTIWALWLNSILLKCVNKIRTWRGIAPLSKTASVWDEVFLNNDAQVIEFGKIDKENHMIGEIKKASRPFEPERNLYLEEVEFFTDLVTKYKIPVSNVFYDIKSGTYVKIFDPESIKQAQIENLKENGSTSSDQTEKID
ncbi:hypothetical protein PP175_21425 [Aneurinibacillus sp. Ricciae_BoGa-3]|uniref:hypothetical protein n=1 Tax=Aneurinibacillus sp. Ricciae_BoGa-3 TaxID=3022697 RepID=UPI00233FF2C8|nr:hypothetical protein [Aneurinibacillus sp. Ricciae_BoGa-3]WCK53853.1 hypothetical protein PP175_21425 [Aneurinibacillus sp. Ricciae_BoGa-3]